MRKLRMGMVGGGEGAFIGAVHRMAAALDGKIELVCGAFSGDAAKSKRSGEALFLPASRVYPDFEAMIVTESLLPQDVRMDFVAIVTPNHVHAAPSIAALKAGFSVVCDKPLCLTLEEAEQIRAARDASGALFCLTHNYSGYPMVKQAKAMVAGGKLGTLRKIVAEYSQGWLSTLLEESNQKQAAWRTDPARSGAAGCMGDIGSHAAHLAEYIIGEHITSCSAHLTTYVPGRKLDDDAQATMWLHGGATLQLTASQIAFGQENALSIHLYGTDGALHWHQQEPNSLRFDDAAGQHIFRTGVGDLSDAAKAATRLPAGHPEGYLEAFANVYLGFASALAQKLGFDNGAPKLDYPTLEDGIQGMKTILATVASSSQKGQLVTI